MADAREDGPKLTLLIGCDGSGRTGWRRANQDLLPEAFFDADSLADALGGWDSRDARERGMELLRREIECAFRERRDVGLKTPGCERTITQLTARAREAGFRVEGTYIGTAAAEINTERILRRGASMQGPRLSREHIANRHRQAQRTLKETAADFDELIVLDNSEPAGTNRPEPRTELVIERGVVVYAARRLSSWACRVRQAMANAAEQKAHRKARDREPSRRNEEDERVLRFDTPGNGCDRTLR